MSRRTRAAEQIRLASLMLGSVDCLLHAMKADGIHDPVTTLRLLVARHPTIPQDEVACRYGHMARALRVVFTYRSNGALVEVAIQQCISIAGSLL